MQTERNDLSNEILDWPVGIGPSERRECMRVLLTTQPAYGHFFPMLPLAVALRSAGHDVAFATSATFCPVVHQHGFPAFPVGLDWIESDWSTLPADEVWLDALPWRPTLRHRAGFGQVGSFLP